MNLFNDVIGPILAGLLILSVLVYLRAWLVIAIGGGAIGFILVSNALGSSDFFCYGFMAVGLLLLAFMTFSMYSRKLNDSPMGLLESWVDVFVEDGQAWHNSRVARRVDGGRVSHKSAANDQVEQAYEIARPFLSDPSLYKVRVDYAAGLVTVETFDFSAKHKAVERTRNDALYSEDGLSAHLRARVNPPPIKTQTFNLRGR